MHLVDLCAVQPYSPKKTKSECRSVTYEAYHKFTPVSDNFIQILNVPSKYWILVFREKIGQISICNSLLTNGNPSKTLLKVYFAW